MDSKKSLTVKYNDRTVGTLARYERYLSAFEYDSEWIEKGFSISPRSLPLEKKVFIPKIDPFDGLFGVFDDSLPDGWGRLLVDRVLIQNGIAPEPVSQLDRLAIVGSSGMGALTYEPEEHFPTQISSYDLDSLAEQCKQILSSNSQADSDSNLDTLFELGGSSGGARPKVLLNIEDRDWLIKFPASTDNNNIGEMEYEYSKCARSLGIEMEEIKLFPSDISPGYFGTLRFDRKADGSRVHMISAGGLLETSHRLPTLDYNILMKLTLQLTQDYREVEKLYRLMCFNVFAHNRDDHAKNFTYLYDESEKLWTLSPAYDLTYSTSIGGEHATTINGNGKNPGKNDVLEVAKNIGLDINSATRIADEVYEVTRGKLKDYL